MLPKQDTIFLSFSMIKHWKTERQSHHSILERHLEDLYLSHSQLKTALQHRNKISALLETENLEQLQPTGLIIIIVWLRSSLISNSLDFKKTDGTGACKHQV